MMKKNSILMILATIALSACLDNNNVANSSLQQERDSLQRALTQRDNELNDIMGIVNDVQEGISQINEAEGRVTIADGSPESASQREVIQENMKFIQEAMQQNRELIEQLKAKFQTSNINADKMKKAIENLQKQIETQSQRIQELEASLAEKDAKLLAQGEEITTLNESVSSLTAENKAKSQTLAEQEAELNSAWFVFGTKAELKEQRILSKGDVLTESDYNKDYFTKIDIRNDKDIKLYSKNANILTNHPSDSYKLAKNNDGLYELHITNPNKFWSASKYLVIQVK